MEHSRAAKIRWAIGVWTLSVLASCPLGIIVWRLYHDPLITVGLCLVEVGIVASVFRWGRLQ